MRFIKMTGFLCFMVAVLPTYSRDQEPRTNPGIVCGEGSAWVPMYYNALYDEIEPPEWRHAAIRISIEGWRKLDLWTDGKTFKLWTDARVPSNIEQFLLDLNKSCRLPADPAEVAKLIKVEWESADLSSTQFEQIHKGFTKALAEYVSSAQRRYSTMEWNIYLDATIYRIKYHNGIEDIDVKVVEDPKQHKLMLDWVHEVQKLAEARFHRPFGLQKPE
jgi:hypothetical protein